MIAPATSALALNISCIGILSYKYFHPTIEFTKTVHPDHDDERSYQTNQPTTHPPACAPRTKHCLINTERVTAARTKRPAAHDANYSRPQFQAALFSVRAKKKTPRTDAHRVKHLVDRAAFERHPAPKPSTMFGLRSDWTGACWASRCGVLPRTV